MSSKKSAPSSWTRRVPSRYTAPFDFDVTLPTTPLQEFAVRWGGYQHLAEGRPATEHPELRYGVLVFIIDGVGKFTCGKRSWKLRSGVVLWARPGLTTRIELAPESKNLEHYAVLPFGTDAGDRFVRNLGSEVGAAAAMQPDAIAHLFEAIIDEGLGHSDHREKNCVDLVKVLLRRLDGQLAHRTRQGQNTAQDTYSRARRYIQANFANTRELEDVATAIDVSIPYLCRLFERYDVTSPFGYLTQLKLTKAAQLLQTTELPIGEIGEMVGYLELHLFSRKFKNAYGLSPSYYRRERREEAERLRGLHQPPPDAED